MTAMLSEGALEAPSLALYGGSFDPVHGGHLHCAEVAERAFDLDHVLFVPAARPPHKPGRVLAAGAERLAMLELALADREGWSVWGFELERSGPSYTIETLRELVRLRGHGRGLHLILGEDNLSGLQEWRAVEELLAIASPLVIRRGERLDESIRALEGELSGAALRRLRAGACATPPLEVCSTELRARIAGGEPPGPGVSEPVWEYIRLNGIYGAR